MSISLAGCFTQQVAGGKPMKFGAYVLPEYFTATFKIHDNDGVDVTKDNASTFDLWTVEFLLRITEAETVEVIRTEILGANPKRTHTIVSSPALPLDPREYGSLQNRHYTQLTKNRPRLVSYAVQHAIQLMTPIDGGRSWDLGLQPKIIPKEELNRLGILLENQSYVKKDQSHYEQVAKRYLDLLASGVATPVTTMQEMYYLSKSVKTVGEWVTECRKRKLLPKAKPGKNSPLPKTRKKGK